MYNSFAACRCNIIHHPPKGYLHYFVHVPDYHWCTCRLLLPTQRNILLVIIDCMIMGRFRGLLEIASSCSIGQFWPGRLWVKVIKLGPSVLSERIIAHSPECCHIPTCSTKGHVVRIVYGCLIVLQKINFVSNFLPLHKNKKRYRIFYNSIFSYFLGF